jgi:DNA repair exonuclease SbcCD ATPase subunit
VWLRDGWARLAYTPNVLYQATTYKCTDINKLVPALMGVSKAVLDNVIFVHQVRIGTPCMLL